MLQSRVRLVLPAAALLLGAGASPDAAADDPPAARRFLFGQAGAMPAAGSVAVAPGSRYDPALGFGFTSDGPVRAAGGAVAADPGGSFTFAAAVPEGVYRVTVTLGDPSAESVTTIKAESRRLMVEAARVPAGATEQRTFLVAVRSAAIAPADGQAAGRVKLKPREVGTPDWDDRMSLEFTGRPAVAAVEIAPAGEVVTVFLAGDSTVTDQAREPWNSWGQMLPRFFGPGVAVANHAESGESLRSFAGGNRFAKVWSQIRPGDYLFLQFGHNDQKERGEGVGAFTTYADRLRAAARTAREHGAIPVIVTPVARRAFDPENKLVNNLGDFPEAARRVAAELGAPLVDLNAMSRRFYEALGPEGSKKAFVDNTHHNNYGSYELARAVVEGIKAGVPDLAAKLEPGLPPFDPGRPDPPASFTLPASPGRDPAAPEGN